MRAKCCSSSEEPGIHRRFVIACVNRHSFCQSAADRPARVSELKARTRTDSLGRALVPALMAGPSRKLDLRDVLPGNRPATLNRTKILNQQVWFVLDENVDAGDNGVAQIPQGKFQDSIATAEHQPKVTSRLPYHPWVPVAFKCTVAIHRGHLQFIPH